MDLGIGGKLAIVTGGSRGIGKAIALELAREGADVALVARDRAALDAAAAELAGETGRRVEGFTADTGDDASVAAMTRAVAARFGRIDILVNCAAMPGSAGGPPPKLADLTGEALWADVNIKVMGYARTAREAAPVMAKAGGGRIVNISGMAARQTGTIIGSIRNIGVSALTKNLAEELSPHGISVVCVHPGNTVTEKTADTVTRRAREQNLPAAEIERRMSANLSRRMMTAQEIGYLVCFLASPKAVSVNGESIAAGGGQPGVIHY